MKKLLIYLLILNSFNLAAQSPNYVPSNNLIGWWPFNGNANDESGNANNGIVNGASLTNDRFGNSNSAYQFNGISSYIQGSLSGLTSTDETSLSIWILSDGDAGGKPYDLFFQLGNYGSHTFAYAYNYSGTNLDLYSNCFINPYTSLNINNQWHHLVIVDDISSSSVYLDGSLYFTWNLQQGAGCYFGSNTFLIGGGADNQYTTGYLDDVGFWDRALTECEIQNLYNSSVTIINTIDNVGTHCDSYTWIDGITYTSSNNTATWLTTNAAGCDNLVTLNLIINNSSTTTIDNVGMHCDSYTWIDGITYTSTNNTATWTTTNAAGCDNIATLNLIINNSTSSLDNAGMHCDSYTWIDGITYTSTNNTATWTTTNAAGCDNIATLNLFINNSTSSLDNAGTHCDSFTWIDGVTYTSSNNTATWTTTNTAGCDNVATLNFTISNSTTSTDTQVTCDTYTWIDGITYTSSNNTATWLTTNAAGCDNLVTLNLIINNSCLFMPNLFTPNGDGIHDIWLIDGLDLYPDVLVQVFNRWGQLLFESKGYSDPWDGTYNGNALPIGAYYYMINLNNNTEPLNGTITIKL
jgi:gliding motility-associated-like protein